MDEYLKDKHGRIIGVIRTQSNIKTIYEFTGKRLGFYDGKCTYTPTGTIVGYGNLLVWFISDKIFC